ncbi:hypothetical protein EIN_022830 [Entamoeba invadens IP1]|uniref:hypothetical protein n=1 Tax=Entamoeba invadens IP1 TaxID=370355 RepID=UPI0002C3DA16|nr:hypothetical protein EIN_022830 [Entamoeba invadens IP1]ELP90644.1 hypothetical protein EIN_022830 [Entamoeba invadens IP1]|eukprot:XP_004257415.1 hypothetical protein EIN_022830 [Entamoeba invadens IP1]
MENRLYTLSLDEYIHLKCEEKEMELIKLDNEVLHQTVTSLSQELEITTNLLRKKENELNQIIEERLGVLAQREKLAAQRVVHPKTEIKNVTEKKPRKEKVEQKLNPKREKMTVRQKHTKRVQTTKEDKKNMTKIEKIVSQTIGKESTGDPNLRSLVLETSVFSDVDSSEGIDCINQLRKGKTESHNSKLGTRNVKEIGLNLPISDESARRKRDPRKRVIREMKEADDSIHFRSFSSSM